MADHRAPTMIGASTTASTAGGLSASDVEEGRSMTDRLVRWAHISEDGVYRYMLGRQWNFDKPIGDLVCWVMLNPSTADGEVDDPTIRRCINFSKAWGYDGLAVVNYFGLRATDPKELAKHTNPEGPANQTWIDAIVTAPSTKLVVAAWGASKVPWHRGSPINLIMQKAQKDLHALGVTKDGYPRHPLYVKGDTQPFVWKKQEAI